MSQPCLKKHPVSEITCQLASGHSGDHLAPVTWKAQAVAATEIDLLAAADESDYAEPAKAQAVTPPNGLTRFGKKRG